jgi:hypothetical protein
VLKVRCIALARACLMFLSSDQLHILPACIQCVRLALPALFCTCGHDCDHCVLECLVCHDVPGLQVRLQQLKNVPAAQHHTLSLSLALALPLLRLLRPQSCYSVMPDATCLSIIPHHTRQHTCQPTPPPTHTQTWRPSCARRSFRGARCVVPDSADYCGHVELAVPHQHQHCD